MPRKKLSAREREQILSRHIQGQDLTTKVSHNRTCREIPRSDPRFKEIMDQIVWREPEETGDHSRFQVDE